MKINVENAPANEVQADAIVVGIWKDEALSGATQQVDEACGGLLTRLIDAEELSASTCSVKTLYGLSGINAPVVTVVGLGKRDASENSLSFRAAGAAAKQLAGKSRGHVAFLIDLPNLEHAIAGAMVGCQGQDIMRADLKLNPFEQISWNGASEAQLKEGTILGESLNLTRRLVNLPANEIFPESFAEECVRVGKDAGFHVEVWDENKLADEKCGALLAVAKGSDRPPRLVIMKYNGASEGTKPIALVGKGVTFDSGGLSLKPSAGMLDMKCDMAGGATVLGAITSIASLGLPVNVVGIVGLAENMISGNCFRLGDVLVARSGKTIEVHNTDAEGRLLLADALNVAQELEPRAIVDLATLTGSCMVALGVEYCGVMTNDQTWCDQVLSAAQDSGELVWQLPMHELFDEHVKSKIADIKNVGNGRWGGAITAGKFLQEFVDDDMPWVHIDIAGPSFADSPSSWIDAGASGCMLLTLVELAKQGG